MVANFAFRLQYQIFDREAGDCNYSTGIQYFLFPAKLFYESKITECTDWFGIW